MHRAFPAVTSSSSACGHIPAAGRLFFSRKRLRLSPIGELGRPSAAGLHAIAVLRFTELPPADP